MSIFLFNHTEGKQYKFLPQLCTINVEKEKKGELLGPERCSHYLYVCTQAENDGMKKKSSAIDTRDYKNSCNFIK